MARATTIGYQQMRIWVGIWGILLPIILPIGVILLQDCSECTLSSISIYYHTVMRDAFVGILCAVAFFLFAYEGYDRNDNVITTLAALFALGVAFFPTQVTVVTECLRAPHRDGSFI